jgi:hypothetical protein
MLTKADFLFHNKNVTTKDFILKVSFQLIL